MKAALQFLTVLPVRGAEGEFGAAWFPLVGALLGLAVAACCRLPGGALWGLAFLAVVTGGLHEDGLADVCDALRAYRSRERMMEILHDSRIGAHGALALVLSVLVRWQGLERLSGSYWIRIPAALAIARFAMLVLAASTGPAGEGLGARFHQSLSVPTILIAGAQAVALLAFCGLPAMMWMVATQGLILLAARGWFLARLGGTAGDCLGFQCQLSEAAALTVFTWV
jgi:adenosylcobinamide-GDP ribazoletransferase